MWELKSQIGKKKKKTSTMSLQKNKIKLNED